MWNMFRAGPKNTRLSNSTLVTWLWIVLPRDWDACDEYGYIAQAFDLV